MSDESIDRWNRFWSSKDDPGQVYSSSPRVLEAILERLPEGAPRVLEVGAGTGRDTAALAATGARAVALDASAEALSLVARAAPVLVGRGIVAGDALHLPFRDAAFDAVFHQGVLEHFGNPRAFLVENRRILAPGGLLVVDVPQTWHPWTALKRVALRFDRWFAGWETEFTPAGLERVVAEAGFDVLDAYGDWMVPSLGYRLLREGLGRAAVPLPLAPSGPPALRRVRQALGERLRRPAAGRWLAHTIGVVARRSSGG